MDAKDASNYNGGYIANDEDSKNGDTYNNKSEESDDQSQLNKNSSNSEKSSKSKGKQKAVSSPPSFSSNSAIGANSVDQLDASFERLLSIEPNVTSQTPGQSKFPSIITNTSVSNIPNLKMRNRSSNNFQASNNTSNVAKKSDLFTNTANIDRTKNPFMNKKSMIFGNQLSIDTSLKSFGTSSPPRRRNQQALRPDNSYKQQQQQPTNILRNRLYRSPDLTMSPLSDDLETPLFSANPLSAMTPLVSSVEDYHGGNYFKTLPPSVSTTTTTNKCPSTESSSSPKLRSMSSNSNISTQNNNNSVSSPRLFTVVESGSTNSDTNNRTNYTNDNGPLSSISSQLFSSNVETTSVIGISNTENDANNNLNSQSSNINSSTNTGTSDFASSSSAERFSFAEMHAKIGDDDPFYKSSDFDQVIDLFDILKSEKKNTGRNKVKTKSKSKKKPKTEVKREEKTASHTSKNERKNARKRRNTKSGKEKMSHDDSSGYEGEVDDEDFIDKI